MVEQDSATAIRGYATFGISNEESQRLSPSGDVTATNEAESHTAPAIATKTCRARFFFQVIFDA